MTCVVVLGVLREMIICAEGLHYGVGSMLILMSCETCVTLCYVYVFCVA